MKYEPLVHVVLYQPQIPPNTGAVGRTCVAVGAKLWLVRPLGFRIDEKSRRRAGLDYWEHLEWETVASWQALTDALAPARFWFFTKHATQSYTSVSFQRGDVLVFGSETNGLPPSLLAEHSDRALLIPIRPQVRSLNLSCSVAIAAYEAARQCGE
ncbi:tRNA (cytidine(34)-2'-O)-methyltransferase [Lignipirellula cremea]|uniref:tRNA (cytidine(34)-2'-O)-methyltransferase n=1 Tax=Lignipirellula cremea TaxID=2528010 RepID=UPI0011A8CFBC|nr:tRNA (cytidine(34)-2'-O)-methyltransferase [Lignipirellula cremea]